MCETDRCEQVAFSEPLSQMPLAFIVKSGNPMDLNKYEDFLAKNDAKLAATTGTTESLLAVQAGIPDDQVLLFDQTSDAILAVHAGRADAAAELLIGAKFAAANWPDHFDLQVADPIYEVNGVAVSGHTAFVLHPDETEFLNELNNQLSAFVGSEEYMSIVEKYGFDSSTLPTKSTAEVCSE